MHHWVLVARQTGGFAPSVVLGTLCSPFSLKWSCNFFYFVANAQVTYMMEDHFVLRLCITPWCASLAIIPTSFDFCLLPPPLGTSAGRQCWSWMKWMVCLVVTEEELLTWLLASKQATFPSFVSVTTATPRSLRVSSTIACPCLLGSPQNSR